MNDNRTHELAIRAISDCIAEHSYGSYQDAVNTMLPLYKAAPELLEALKLCERALEERDAEAEEYAAKRARAAIDKAKGDE